MPNLKFPDDPNLIVAISTFARWWLDQIDPDSSAAEPRQEDQDVAHCTPEPEPLLRGELEFWSWLGDNMLGSPFVVDEETFDAATTYEAQNYDFSQRLTWKQMVRQEGEFVVADVGLIQRGTDGARWEAMLGPRPLADPIPDELTQDECDLCVLEGTCDKLSDVLLVREGGFGMRVGDGVAWPGVPESPGAEPVSPPMSSLTPETVVPRTAPTEPENAADGISFNLPPRPDGCESVALTLQDRSLVRAEVIIHNGSYWNVWLTGPVSDTGELFLRKRKGARDKPREFARQIAELARSNYLRARRKAAAT